MSWQNDSRVDEYWLKLTDPNGIILYKKWHPALCTGETCSLALDLTNFSTKAVQKGVYRWQVKARRDEVSGVTRSINASFMLNLTIPLSTPADGLEITSGSLQTFSWYEHDTLTAYRLKMTSGGVVTTTAWFPATSICSEGICTRIEKVKIAAGSDTVKWQVQGRSAKISGKVKSDKRRLIRS
jgi:hypothetical protein